ncbi:unnamed protein product, partial [Brenthis ino]
MKCRLPPPLIRVSCFAPRVTGRACFPNIICARPWWTQLTNNKTDLPVRLVKKNFVDILFYFNIVTCQVILKVC